MPALMTRDTRAALGVGAALCDNRSLWLDRFADQTPAGPGHGVANLPFFSHAISLKSNTLKLESWKEFILNGLGLPADELLFGRLEARLLLNTSGGLLDPAGCCVDRLTGVPWLPGSAIKGCARRYAMHWLQGAESPPEATERLVAIAQVFGWTDSDWKNSSDFAWACGHRWPEIRLAAQQRLWNAIRRAQSYSWPDWQQHGSCRAAQVQFLPAYPWESPPGDDLELDVSGCHHPAYYEGDPRFALAPDIEEPAARLFLAVAPRHVFAFALIGEPACRPLARQWLQEGLATFGLGARVTSGYGWFDTSPALQQLWRAKAVERQQIEQNQRRAQQELLECALEEEARRKTSEAVKLARDQMTPEQLEDFKLSRLTDEQFRSKLQSFPRHMDRKELQKEILAIVRTLGRDRLALWEDLKLRAQKGGLWGQVVEAVRWKAKKANLGKMP